MSKKQTKKTESKKGQAKGKKARGAAAQAAPRAEGASQGAAPEARLPPVGTVIKKRDRHGQVRCECKVVETGIRYKGRDFTSLSGAAMAAAKDLDLKNKTQNGWVFCGLTKPGRKLEDPVGALGKSFSRHHNLATLVTSRSTDESRAAIRGALQEQRHAIDELLTQVAS